MCNVAGDLATDKGPMSCFTVNWAILAYQVGGGAQEGAISTHNHRLAAGNLHE